MCDSHPVKNMKQMRGAVCSGDGGAEGWEVGVGGELAGGVRSRYPPQGLI